MTKTPSNRCVVIVTVDAAPDVFSEMEEHARYGLRRFAEFDGFIGGILHKNREETRLVQYLHWQSVEHHLKCMNDPQWDELESTKHFLELVKSGVATMEVADYRIVEVAGDVS